MACTISIRCSANFLGRSEAVALGFGRRSQSRTPWRRWKRTSGRSSRLRLTYLEHVPHDDLLRYGFSALRTAYGCAGVGAGAAAGALLKLKFTLGALRAPSSALK